MRYSISMFFKYLSMKITLTLRFELGFLNPVHRLYFELLPNSRKDWKLGFLDVALVGLLNFSQFMRDGKLGFLFISLGRFYFQTFTEKLENWYFWIAFNFIFCQTVNHSGICRRGGANLRWNWQFLSKETFIFMQQFCISLNTGNTSSRLIVNEAKNCKISPGLAPRPTAVFGRNDTCLPGLCFGPLFLMCNNIFPLFYQCRLFYFRDSKPGDQANLVLNSIEKVKHAFLLSLTCMIPESNRTKFWSHIFTSKIKVFCRPEWAKGGTNTCS